MLCYYRDPKFPQVNFLIIRSRYESTASVNESHCINWSHMLFIFLNDVARIDIILKDLLIRTTGEENILLGVVGVERNTWRSFFVREVFDYFACFSIPKENRAIEWCTQEFSAIIREANIFYCFAVTQVCSHTLSISHYIPNFARTIVASRKHQMTIFWKESNTLYSLIVPFEGMNPFFGNVVRRLLCLTSSLIS